MKTSDTDRDKELARVFGCLSAEARLRILGLLKNRVLCVGALAARLGLSQGAVSQHLRILRDAGLVVPEKRGYFVHYRLNPETLSLWRQEIDRLLAPGGLELPCFGQEGG